jgi:23S rRNA pseudouridine1911/1915/1917 synthase
MFCYTSPMLDIVYENSDLLVINKPSGISVHKASPNDPQKTIVDFVVERYPDITHVGEDPIRPGIVHRLDKETSGVMVIAKTNPAFFHLKEQFKNREARKTYIALVYGHPKSPQGTITASLGKIGTKQTTQIKGKKDLFEREAVTDYKTVKKYRDYSLLEVSPKTGRTHQIRVHLKSIGTPIVADALYGPKNAKDPSGTQRLFLHAQRLQFTAPDGQLLAIECDLPEELQKILSVLQ